MIELPISRCARRLTEAEKEQFQNWGYVKNLPVFDDSQIPILQVVPWFFIKSIKGELG